MKKILLPISFSETSKNALHHANFIAKQYGVKLSLLNCYPLQEYRREYEFEEVDYDEGIKQMLLNFYTENIGHPDKNIKLLTIAGAVSDIISEISHKYDLLVLSRKTGFQLKSNKWLSDKIFYITSKSLCPVLLLTSKRDAFSFSGIKNIWHIQRKDNESELIEQELLKLKVDPNLVIAKSLEQETFTSAFWKNIVYYSKTHDESRLKKIEDSFANEHIDLLILVNHRKGLFERFLKDDAFQIISQFDIPILVLQSSDNDD